MCDRGRVLIIREGTLSFMLPSFSRVKLNCLCKSFSSLRIVECYQDGV